MDTPTSAENPVRPSSVRATVALFAGATAMSAAVVVLVAIVWPSQKGATWAIFVSLISFAGAYSFTGAEHQAKLAAAAGAVEERVKAVGGAALILMPVTWAAGLSEVTSDPLRWFGTALLLVVLAILLWLIASRSARGGWFSTRPTLALSIWFSILVSLLSATVFGLVTMELVSRGWVEFEGSDPSNASELSTFFQWQLLDAGPREPPDHPAVGCAVHLRATPDRGDRRPVLHHRHCPRVLVCRACAGTQTGAQLGGSGRCQL